MSSARGSSNRREVSTPLLVLMGMVALVLLIACANVASLMVARTEERQREIAVRTALGACGPDRMRQPGAESLLMAVLGGGAGLLVAVWTRDALLHSLPSPHRVQALALEG